LSGVPHSGSSASGVGSGWLRCEPIGRGHFWYGALELGLEPLYQHYTTSKPGFWAGLTAVGRYHLLGLGRFVPYLEGGAAAGGTDLRIPEIDSTFAFLIFAGGGVCGFVSDTTPLYAGYLVPHPSNGHTRPPHPP